MHFFYLSVRLLYFSGLACTVLRYLRKKAPMKNVKFISLIILVGWASFGILTSRGERPSFDPADDFFRLQEATPAVRTALQEACYDCHSYQTRYPWYAHVPPLSNWIDGHVGHGREDLNFSEWGKVGEQLRDDILKDMIEVIKEEAMPLSSYKWMHPGARWPMDVRDSVLKFLSGIQHSYSQQAGELVGGPCEGCEAVFEFGDRQLSAVDTLPDFNAEGKKIKVTGTIYKNDGKTPAEDVILYVYHTDQNGIYPTKGNEQGWAKRHGYIRGWVKTGSDGKYTFYTLQPGVYPSRSAPAHIHPVILEPSGKYYWLGSYHFKGDPLLRKEDANPKNPRGGSSGLLELRKEGNLWVGTRDIVLGENVPGY
jgi:protocatechuate 3,4-dioxygenase beta subunit